MTGGRKKAKSESEAGNSPGCICPEGCKIGEPIDQENPGSASKVVCSNEENGRKCTAPSLYIHAECMENWEEKLCNFLKKGLGTNRRGADNWTDKQRFQNLWTQKGYEVLFKTCPCTCGGYLRKDLDYQPKPHQQTAVGEDMEKRKKKKAEKQLPKCPGLPGHLRKSQPIRQKPRQPSPREFFDDDSEVYLYSRKERTTATSWEDFGRSAAGFEGVSQPNLFPALLEEEEEWAEPEPLSSWAGAASRPKNAQGPKDIVSPEALISVLYDLIGEKGRIGLDDLRVRVILGRLNANLRSEVGLAGGMGAWVQSIGPSCGLLLTNNSIVKNIILTTQNTDKNINQDAVGVQPKKTTKVPATVKTQAPPLQIKVGNDDTTNSTSRQVSLKGTTATVPPICGISAHVQLQSIANVLACTDKYALNLYKLEKLTLH